MKHCQRIYRQKVLDMERRVAADKESVRRMKIEKGYLFDKK